MDGYNTSPGACTHNCAPQDRDEPTLELSLFAEAFQEMLVRDYGTQILNSLYMERQAPSCAQHHHAPGRRTTDLDAEMGAAHRNVCQQDSGHALWPSRLRKLLAWVVTAASCGVRHISVHVAAKPRGRGQAARVSCREAALRRREERKRKREKEERAAGEKAEADRVAAEKAPAGKEGAKGVVVSEGQTAQPLEEQSGGVKEETGITEVKEEGSTDDAPVAAAPLVSQVPNGNDVSAGVLHDSPQLVAALSEVPARVALLLC